MPAPLIIALISTKVWPGGRRINRRFHTNAQVAGLMPTSVMVLDLTGLTIRRVNQVAEQWNET